jgi:hypothetical protein
VKKKKETRDQRDQRIALTSYAMGKRDGRANLIRELKELLELSPNDPVDQ